MGLSRIFCSMLLMIMLMATCEAVLFGGVGLVNGDVSSTSTIPTPTPTPTSFERTPTTQAATKISTTDPKLVASDKSTHVYADNHSPVRGIHSISPTVMVPYATKTEVVVTQTKTSYTRVTEEKRKPTMKQFSTVSSIGDTPETTPTSRSASLEKSKQETSTRGLNIPTKPSKLATDAVQASSDPNKVTQTAKSATKDVTSTPSATITSAVASAATTTTKATTVKVTAPEATTTRAAETPQSINSTVSTETVTQVTTSTTTRNDNSSDKGSTFSKYTSSQTVSATPLVTVSNNDSQVQHVATSAVSMVASNTSVAITSTAAPTTHSTETKVTKISNETNNQTSSAITVQMLFNTSTKAHAEYLLANTTPAVSENSTDMYQNSTADPDRLQLMFTDDDTSDSFWPVVMALTIVIPSVVVFGVTITVLYRRRMAKPRRPYSGDYDQM